MLEKLKSLLTVKQMSKSNLSLLEDSNLKKVDLDGVEEVRDYKISIMYSLFVCTNCNVIWNRNLNRFPNLYNISFNYQKYPQTTLLNEYPQIEGIPKNKNTRKRHNFS